MLVERALEPASAVAKRGAPSRSWPSRSRRSPRCSAAASAARGHHHHARRRALGRGGRVVDELVPRARARRPRSASWTTAWKVKTPPPLRASARETTATLIAALRAARSRGRCPARSRRPRRPATKRSTRRPARCISARISSTAKKRFYCRSALARVAAVGAQLDQLVVHVHRSAPRASSVGLGDRASARRRRAASQRRTRTGSARASIAGACRNSTASAPAGARCRATPASAATTPSLSCG